jgi:hypothetical protein
MDRDGWFASLKLLPEFGRRLRHHWAAAVMGGTVPGIGLFVWSLAGSVPHLDGRIGFGWCALVFGLLCGRDEHLGKLEGLLRLRIKIDEIAVYGGLGLVWIRATVFNAGPPTIVEDWVLGFPDSLDSRTVYVSRKVAAT